MRVADLVSWRRQRPCVGRERPPTSRVAPGQLYCVAACTRAALFYAGLAAAILWGFLERSGLTRSCRLSPGSPRKAKHWTFAPGGADRIPGTGQPLRDSLAFRRMSEVTNTVGSLWQAT